MRQWSQRPILPQYGLDQVQAIPLFDDVWYPPENPEEEDVPDLLNSALLKAIKDLDIL